MDPVADGKPLPWPSPSLDFSAAAAGLDLDVLLASRRFGTSLGAPQTNLVLRAADAVPGPPDGELAESQGHDPPGEIAGTRSWVGRKRSRAGSRPTVDTVIRAGLRA